ncbi:MAG: ABC transporter permease [Bacteroidetes bacterium]|nr:ABC transporter permease [Bacteroidota bacterium]
MRRLFAHLVKELLILVRDIPGLLILFIMPLLLIIVVTLAQQNAFKSFRDNKPDILFLNRDTGVAGKTIHAMLDSTGVFNLVTRPGKTPLDEKQLRKEVTAGKFQVGIIIPANTTQAFRELATKAVSEDIPHHPEMDHGPVLLILDPATNDSYINSIVQSLERITSAVETRLKLEELTRNQEALMKRSFIDQLNKALEVQRKVIEREVNRELANRFGKNFQPISLADHLPAGLPETGLDIPGRQLLMDTGRLPLIRTEVAVSEKITYTPTLIQNNVPAFTLFAMFFIVLPMAGSLLHERNGGPFTRLRSMPVTGCAILSGKVIVYAAICALQFILLTLTGMYLLPEVFGIPALHLPSHPLALLVTVFASALGAIGFGLLIGSFARTHGQAGMVGSLLVVILALFSGVFLPIYLMPEFVRTVSWISPVRWGIDAFLELFVRQASFAAIWKNIVLLLLFFTVSAGISSWKIFRDRS